MWDALPWSASHGPDAYTGGCRSSWIAAVWHLPLKDRQHHFKLPMHSPVSSGLSILCTPKWVVLIPWRNTAAALSLHNTPTLCAHWSPLHCLVQRLAQSLHCHLSRWPNLYPSSLHRLPLELGLPLCGIFVVVCNQTFISVSSLVQSKLIILADFSTVSGGSSGTLSMLLALMMHNTNPSLDQECAVMMN